MICQPVTRLPNLLCRCFCLFWLSGVFATKVMAQSFDNGPIPPTKDDLVSAITWKVQSITKYKNRLNYIPKCNISATILNR